MNWSIKKFNNSFQSLSTWITRAFKENVSNVVNLIKVSNYKRCWNTWANTYSIKDYKNRLLFLDTPYYLQKASKLYGKNGDMHESFDHEGLLKVLDNTSNWVLCYNDCSYIRKLYTEYTIIPVDWSYGMNKTKKSSEILILCLWLHKINSNAECN